MLLQFTDDGDLHRIPQRRRNRLTVPSDSGEVDMVDLEQLLADLVKHADSWPFVKPVTRAEVRIEMQNFISTFAFRV